MANESLEFWNWNGTVTRGTYAFLGLCGFAVKLIVDRCVLHSYQPLWGGYAALPAQRHIYPTLLVIALPFLWLSVTFTVKRLRDAGQAVGLAALLFVPFVNLLFFVVLCVLPSRRINLRPVRPEIGEERSELSGKEGRWESALVGVAIAAVLAVMGTWAALRVSGVYGLTLFIGLPFVLGYTAVWFHCRKRPREPGEVAVVISMAVFLAGAMVTVIALEGIICILMAAPIAWVLALVGGLVAYAIHNRPDAARAPQTFAALFLAIPLLMGAEHVASPPVPRYEVHTAVEIAAPPEVVWRHVVAFPAMPAPRDWPFRLGFAYPVEVRLTGEGLSADRECRWSTGMFREPILVWEPGKHLAFAVSGQPMLMKETSPYRDIHVRHLEDHDFQPERVDFVITPLEAGRSRLEATSIYQNRMWPGAYWRVWTDSIIHRIHYRVFEHIKNLSESDVMARDTRRQ